MEDSYLVGGVQGTATQGCRKNIGNGRDTCLSELWRSDTDDFRSTLPQVPREFWGKHFSSLSLATEDDDCLQWITWTSAIFSDVIQGIAFTLWNLWKIGNDVVFMGSSPPLKFLSQSSGTKCMSMIQSPINFRRKLMCDGSFIDDIQKARSIVVMYNDEVQVVDGRATTIFCRDVIVAEAEAILKAVEMAGTERDPCVIISDYKTLVEESVLLLRTCRESITTLLQQFERSLTKHQTLVCFGRRGSVSEMLIGLLGWLEKICYPKLASYEMLVDDRVSFLV
ncbi:hypothetical protein LINPERPRIM_LOCUS38547 [Linum perenne]